jgi:tRNA A37 threonylcarbamoyladenosine synthetase subunit TsaC/SUA5/YrdC
MAVILPYDATPLEQLAQHVQAVLHRSGVLGIPTETFYGLGVNPFDPTALSRLCTVKRRFEGTPIRLQVRARRRATSRSKDAETAPAVLARRRARARSEANRPRSR